jgi:hypothetical protein
MKTRKKLACSLILCAIALVATCVGFKLNIIPLAAAGIVVALGTFVVALRQDAKERGEERVELNKARAALEESIVTAHQLLLNLDNVDEQSATDAIKLLVEAAGHLYWNPAWYGPHTIVSASMILARYKEGSTLVSQARQKIGC